MHLRVPQRVSLFGRSLSSPNRAMHLRVPQRVFLFGRSLFRPNRAMHLRVPQRVSLFGRSLFRPIRAMHLRVPFYSFTENVNFFSFFPIVSVVPSFSSPFKILSARISSISFWITRRSGLAP